MMRKEEEKKRAMPCRAFSGTFNDESDGAYGFLG